MTTGVRFNSGKTFLVGYGTRLPSPIALDPEQYEGALVYADDGEMYYSDGTDWIVISGAPIRRPFALTPIVPSDYRKLRLSAFDTSGGATNTQTGIIFRVSLNSDMTNPFFTTTVNSVSANSYELPSGFLAAGTTFYWQGKYLATENQESQYSKAFAQVFPALIDTPVPINIAGTKALALRVGPYGSAFGLTYGSTLWQVYTNSEGGGAPLYSATNTETSINLGSVQATVIPGATYYWRARFNDNTSLSSASSAIQSFVMDSSFLVRDTANTQFYVGRTVFNNFGTAYATPATVRASNGTAYVCP